MEVERKIRNSNPDAGYGRWNEGGKLQILAMTIVPRTQWNGEDDRFILLTSAPAAFIGILYPENDLTILGPLIHRDDVY